MFKKYIREHFLEVFRVSSSMAGIREITTFFSEVGLQIAEISILKVIKRSRFAILI